jgi:hypothetical protein
MEVLLGGQRSQCQVSGDRIGGGGEGESAGEGGFSAGRGDMLGEASALGEPMSDWRSQCREEKPMLGVKPVREKSRFRGWSQCGEGANARWGGTCSKRLQRKELVLGERSQCREEEPVPGRGANASEEAIAWGRESNAEDEPVWGGGRNCQEK